MGIKDLRNRWVMAGFAACLWAGSAWAQSGGEKMRREPPPQAFEDCKGKNEGDKLTITTPHGDKMEMMCAGSEKGLFARPEKPPQGGMEGGMMREPPPQAFDDCVGKKEGEQLTITTPHGDKMDAVCVASPKGLFARPAHPPEFGKDGGMRREPPPQAFSDCKGKKEGDKLTITTPRGEMQAICAASPKGLFARPEKPPEFGGAEGGDKRGKPEGFMGGERKPVRE